MKKTFTTLALALVITFGTTFANAGIIVGDAVETPKCSTTEKGSIGIIVGDLVGIIVGDLTGIIVGDLKSTPCSEKGGIIVSDSTSTGIIVGD